MVGPRGLVRRRSYWGPAIALALAQYGAGLTTAGIRNEISPATHVGVAATERWVTVERWAQAARCAGMLGLGPMEVTSNRMAAAQMVMALAGRGGYRLGDNLVVRAFEGAAIAA